MKMNWKLYYEADPALWAGMAEAIKNPICSRGNGEDSTSRAQWRICVYFFLPISAGGLFILLEKTEKTQLIFQNTLPAGEEVYP